MARSALQILRPGFPRRLDVPSFFAAMKMKEATKPRTPDAPQKTTGRHGFDQDSPEPIKSRRGLRSWPGSFLAHPFSGKGLWHLRNRNR